MLYNHPSAVHQGPVSHCDLSGFSVPKLIKLQVSQKKKPESFIPGTKSNYCIFPKQPAKVTVSVCIPHKENLVKLSLAYFTAMLRAPQEYAVRRNGLRLFYLILWSRNWWESEW